MRKTLLEVVLLCRSSSTESLSVADYFRYHLESPSLTSWAFVLRQYIAKLESISESRLEVLGGNVTWISPSCFRAGVPARRVVCAGFNFQIDASTIALPAFIATEGDDLGPSYAECGSRLTEATCSVRHLPTRITCAIEVQPCGPCLDLHIQ